MEKKTFVRKTSLRERSSGTAAILLEGFGVELKLSTIQHLAVFLLFETEASISIRRFFSRLIFEAGLYRSCVIPYYRPGLYCFRPCLTQILLEIRAAHIQGRWNVFCRELMIFFASEFSIRFVNSRLFIAASIKTRVSCR